jgi:integrase
MSIRKKKYTRPLPADATITEKSGVRTAKWKDARGKAWTGTVTADGAKVLVRSDKYTARYRDGAGHLCDVPAGCRDKAAAMQVLSTLQKRSDDVRSGLRSATEDAVLDHQATPIQQHVDAYLAHQTAKGRNAVRIANTKARLARINKECAFKRLSDLDAAKFDNWLDEQAAAGMSAGNRNEFRSAIVGFCNWCCKATVKRLVINPLVSVPMADAKSDKRRQQRALTEAEIAALLRATAERPLKEAITVRRGKNAGKPLATVRDDVRASLTKLGYERSLLYKTMLLTGLRLNEVRSLTVAQLSLDDPASVTLDPRAEKNREGNTLQLRDDLAADLRAWVADKSPTGKVFNVAKGLLRIFDRDLAAAGIPKRDARGRTVSLHGLRHSFVTHLSRKGVAPRTAQAAARHSDLKLTMNVYTDESQLQVREALDVLPSMTLCASEGHVALAPHVPIHVRESDSTRQNVANLVKMAVDAGFAFQSSVIDVTSCYVNEKGPLTSIVNEPLEGGAEGSRTLDLCIANQVSRLCRNALKRCDYRHFMHFHAVCKCYHFVA